MNVSTYSLAADGRASHALPSSHVVALFFPSSLCFPLKRCLTSPPAFHTRFYVSFPSMLYHPLMLLL